MTLTKLYSLFLQSAGVCTDTRKLKQGEIYIALKGENFDGNLFAEKALENGALAVVVDDNQVVKKEDEKYVLVENGLKTLQDLAHHHRMQFPDLEVIAITGSNGKTTTKELVGAVLKTQYKVLVTQGNFNNHIGLPLTLLQLKKGDEIAVLEMGDNKPGDIKELCEIAEPQYGLITNIGYDHIGFYGSMDANAKGKLELFEYIITEKKGILYVNQDDTYLKPYTKYLHLNAPPLQDFVENALALPYSVGDFGLVYEPLCKIVKKGLESLEVYLFLPSRKKPLRIKSTLSGSYNAENIIAAAVIGLNFEIPNEQIKSAIESYLPTNQRSQLIKLGEKNIILDCYNANPSSMKVAIENIVQLNSKNGVLLGDMLELGQFSEEEHRKLGELLNKCNLECIVLIGNEIKNTMAVLKNKNLHWFETTADAQPAVADLMKNCEVILFKGSRGIGLEALLNCFEIK